MAGRYEEMRKLMLIGFILVFALAFLMTTHLVYAKPPNPTPTPPASIFYYGYAKLDDGDSYTIVSDTRGQYVDRNLTPGKPPKNRRGDRIEVQLKYNTTTKSYDLAWFCCFIGRPCPVYNSDRRARINFDMWNATEGSDYLTNQTIADMLAYKNTIPFPSKPRGMLNNDSVHILFEKGWGSSNTNNNKIWAVFLIDKTNDATDSDAITQTNLLELNPSAPHYFTSRNGAACENIEDEDQIAFFFLDDQLEDQIDFNPIGWEMQSGVRVPTTWEVTPKTSSPEISVRTIDPSKFDACVYPLDQPRKVLYTVSSGLAFKLTVSKYPSFPVNLAPPKQGILTSAWGEIKGE